MVTIILDQSPDMADTSALSPLLCGPRVTLPTKANDASGTKKMPWLPAPPGSFRHEELSKLEMKFQAAAAKLRDVDLPTVGGKKRGLLHGPACLYVVQRVGQWSDEEIIMHHHILQL